jgi:hypothetical protein
MYYLSINSFRLPIPRPNPISIIASVKLIDRNPFRKSLFNIAINAMLIPMPAEANSIIPIFAATDKPLETLALYRSTLLSASAAAFSLTSASAGKGTA